MSLEELATEHGGRRSVGFSQIAGLGKNWAQLSPQSQKGVCGGLSLIWLASRKLDMTTTVFAEKYGPGLFKYAEHAQELGADNRSGQAAMDNLAKSFSLERAGAEVTVLNDNVRQWILHGLAQYVFIALTGHAVAADVSKKPKVLFFDPNFGVFSFPDTLKFFLFFRDYLQYANQTACFVKYYR
jgi:hypothetical protein